MTRKLLALLLLLAAATVWWRVLNAEKPRKLNEVERRQSVAPIRKGSG